MAAAGWLIVICSGGSLALDVTTLVLAVLAEDCVPGVIQFTLKDPHQRLCMMLVLVAAPLGALLLLAESCWLKYELHHQQQQPPPADVKLLVVLIVLEWLLAFATLGAASSALIVDLVATPECASYQFAADGMACAAGALAAASAVGLLWVLGSRLRHAQAQA